VPLIPSPLPTLPSLPPPLPLPPSLTLLLPLTLSLLPPLPPLPPPLPGPPPPLLPLSRKLTPSLLYSSSIEHECPAGAASGACSEQYSSARRDPVAASLAPPPDTKGTPPTNQHFPVKTRLLTFMYYAKGYEAIICVLIGQD
jgi:hypothetical protein